MRRPTTLQRRFVILTLALITFGFAYYAGISHKTSRDTSGIHGISISPPTPVPAFELQDHANESYDDKRLLNHWSLLMLDPSGMSQPTPAFTWLLKIHNRLAARPELQQKVHYLYLPKSSGAALRSTISQLSSNIIGLHGSPQLTEETFTRFGVDQNRSDPVLYLIEPQGRLHVLFTDDVDAATIAKDLIQLLTSK
jgi:cytochrome oxidase Cu insertion factor (SCO1/SenC/PrrC family)